MNDVYFIYATGGLVLLYFATQVARGVFDPFAPIWLFLVGYVQVYLIQAYMYHDWAVGVRGPDLVRSANFRAFWALLWFLTVYHLGLGRAIAARLPGPPRAWSPKLVATLSPVLIVWGLFCAGITVGGGDGASESSQSDGISLLRAFPFLMMVAAVLLIVTGRTTVSPRPGFLAAGIATAGLYVLIWMFNGKRSHSLIGVLATVCVYYITRLRRPSWPVLFATGFAGMLVVAIAIGWRGNTNYERSLGGFVHFLGDFKVSKILESLNVSQDDGDSDVLRTYETEEYGGFLLILDTVPEKSEYDYGESYKRVVSTFIPRFIWPSKPFYGRKQWVSAWIAGSEMVRDESFTGPAIGILGATQLNGGAIGTLIVLACVATLLSTAYAFFLLYADVPWAQFWWAITYYNAWFMVVNDDPLVWFYYNWGFTTFPIVILFWWANKFSATKAAMA